MNNTASILCVDDDPNILSALKRQLYSKYNVFTAENGEEGLQVLKENDSISVVLSDMRMPKMNGATFLTKVKETSPNTVRVLLTGQSDLSLAIDAINDGQIYRFLMKPCEQEELFSTLDSAVLKNQLLDLEDDLLKKTLYSSAGLIDLILHSIQPLGHRIACRVQNYVKHMVEKLNLPNKKQFLSAAMLSQIGCLNLPREIVQKIHQRENLSDNEKDIVDKHLIAGWNLITKAAELKLVALILNNLKEHYTDQKCLSHNADKSDLDIIGAQIIKIAIDLDFYITEHKELPKALQVMQGKTDFYNKDYLSLLEDYKPE